MNAPKRKRRWFQYSLRTLLVLVTVCAALCSWIAVKMQQAKRQREAAAAIEALGGIVHWDRQSRLEWLGRLLGDGVFSSVSGVAWDSGEVTDANLEDLKEFQRLEFLSLRGTHITDAGLERLNGLSQLRELYLSGTQVTDAGLKHLEALTQLYELNLGGTRVTDAGLKHLQGLSELSHLHLGHTQVTETGLEHLKPLKNLCSLTVQGTKVTEEGIERHRARLPECNIMTK